ncbi:MAG: phosphate/phosphite/phosphonate ABC transporter substrate-binding protein [Deltaproteobacteria bacterium]|nr:phosphate/phosphite/phosphonate ABC transporter substrate-binding protein [Deltaproteobacteria bacterium]
MFKKLVHFVFLFVMVFALTPKVFADKNITPIVFALKPDKNPDAMIEERKSLEAFLSKELQAPVKVIVPLSSAVILEGFANGSIDLAFLSSLDMLNAIDQKSAQTLLGVKIDGKTFYESYWVSLKDKPYKNIKDLRGKPIAFASRTSTSGYLIPHASLIKKGFLKEKENPETFFGKGNVWYGTGYVSGIEQVLQGQAEAAAVSDYVINKDKYLTPEQKAKLKIVDRQGPIPTHVIAIRSTLDKKNQDRLRAALKKMNIDQNISLRDKLFNSTLAEIKQEKHLAGTKEALQLTGAKL